MEELYTFSSQQFQAIDRRPSSTDNPPSIRKRIITSKFGKKSSIESQASTKEDATCNENKPSPLRKVTFNISCLQQESGIMYEPILPFPKKTVSLAFPQCKENIDQQIAEKKIQAAPQRKLIKLCQLGDRCFSNREKGDKQMISRTEDIINNKLGPIRQRRILSQKLNPKIVPISQRKLPKVFKINFLADQSLPKINRRGKLKQQETLQSLRKEVQSCQLSRYQGSQKAKIFRKQIMFSDD